jgi:hypothetical protein
MNQLAGFESSYLVSGYEFYKLSRWSVCHRYPDMLDINKIQENDIVFLNLDHFIRFLGIMRAMPPKNKYILITHNADTPFTKTHASLLEPYCNKIFAINTQYTSEKVITIPLGFVDTKYKPHTLFAELHANPLPKSILIYMNFDIATNKLKRTECLNAFSSAPWVTIQSAIQSDEFYRQLARSKYVLSPEGTGMDCHRIYESIYLGAIPILKTNPMDDFYRRLPVIIVKQWSEITEQFLIDAYTHYKEVLDQWKTEHKEWFTAKYWISNE